MGSRVLQAPWAVLGVESVLLARENGMGDVEGSQTQAATHFISPS